MMPTLTCSDCTHQFDPRDRRAFVHSDKPQRSTCLACTLLWSRGRKSWCVKNDCQGLFGDGVGWTRKEAEAHLNSGRYDGADCTVVEVVIIEKAQLEQWQ